MSAFVSGLLDAVAVFFAGRTLSLTRSRALRLPRTENALLLGLDGDVDVLWEDVCCCSHGKPGGDDGGLDGRTGSSEKTAASAGGGLDGAVLLSEGNMFAIAHVIQISVTYAQISVSV